MERKFDVMLDLVAPLIGCYIGIGIFLTICKCCGW